MLSEKKMNYLVCIDDTDMPGTKGTGWLVQELCNILEKEQKAFCAPISRHQLFVHKDIPYTSHNSAMCFEMGLIKKNIRPVMDLIINFLETRAEKGSDPGLCMVDLTKDLLGDSDKKNLIEFGKNAKKNVSSKKAAYCLAEQLGIHLSEHGGTGDGVVGALAGIGLRLTGNDGRYRGWYHLGMPGDIVSVETLCKYPFIDQLLTKTGTPLPLNTHVHIGSEKTKTVRLQSRQVVVVVPEDSEKTHQYRTITKQEAKLY